MKVYSSKPSVVIQILAALTFSSTINQSYGLTSEVSKSILRQSLSSIANKITLSPEIIIPEPSDPTAVLLQSSAITNLSQNIRTKAKANAVFLSGAIHSVRNFCTEQETARGSFPSPLPIIYCQSSISDLALKDVAEAGACAYLFSVNTLDHPISSPSDLSTIDTQPLCTSFQDAMELGLQLIPEIYISSNDESSWSEDNVSSLVDSITSICGSEPAAIVFSISDNSLENDEQQPEQEENALMTNIPKIPKTISKKIPILASVTAVAGGGRMGQAVNTCKSSGFNGVLLRSDCVPGYRINPDLDFVSGFWSAAIGDLKSSKSKNFQFRSKVALERDIPLEWYNYQKNVMESGALGTPGGGSNVNTEVGDYVGF